MARIRLRQDTRDLDEAFAKLEEAKKQEKAEEEQRFKGITVKFVEAVEATLRRLAKLSERVAHETLAEFKKIADVNAIPQENVRNFLARAEGQEIFGFELTFTDKSRYLLFFQHCRNFEERHPFSAKMIQYPRQERGTEGHVAINASRVFCYGNSQRGIIRVLTDASYGELSRVVEVVVQIRLKGIQEENYLRQALQMIQREGYLVDPRERKGKSLPRYDDRDFFQRSAWDDSHGADYMLPYCSKDGQYLVMKLQLKSNPDDVKVHAKRFATIPCIVSPRGLCRRYPRPVEKISVLKEMTLLAMIANAQGTVLQLSDDPVALVLGALLKKNVISQAEREVYECRMRDHHWGHKRYLLYHMHLSNGEKISFAAFAEDWKGRHRLFNRDHPNVPYVVMQPLESEEAIAQDLEDQILHMLPLEAVQSQENTSHVSS
ncbi:MAG: hypothetical protein Q7S09_00175 [bacterium]|nr:hypothetical protein [bacterium]